MSYVRNGFAGAVHVNVEDGTTFTVKRVVVNGCEPKVWLSTEDKLHVLSLSDADALAIALAAAAKRAAR